MLPYFYLADIHPETNFFPRSDISDFWMAFFLGSLHTNLFAFFVLTIF